MAKILVIDDEPQVLEYLREMLNVFGFQPGILSIPHFVFKRLEVEEFDLILLDLNMPDTDGFEVLTKLKNHPRFSRIPVIILTGDSNERILEQSFEKGAIDFITKPIQPMVMRARINYALEVQSYIRRIEEHNTQMREDLHLAMEVQQAVFPKLPQCRFLEIVKEVIPYGSEDTEGISTISGDVYDVSVDQDGSCNLFLGDATGHGIAAAFITMMNQVGLRNLPPNLGTRETIIYLNQFLGSSLPNDKFMTALYLRIKPNGQLAFTNAGHPSLMIQRAREQVVEQFEHTGVALGITHDMDFVFEQQECQLYPGDKVIVYTDGLTETRNSMNQAYDCQSLLNSLNNTHGLDAKCTILALMKDLKLFKQNNPFKDDLSLFVLRYQG